MLAEALRSDQYLKKKSYIILLVPLIPGLISCKGLERHLPSQLEHCHGDIDAPVVRLGVCRAHVEIMVEPGNLVPSQKPKVAAIFRQNPRIMSKIHNLQTF